MKRTIEISTSGTRLFLKDKRLVVHRDDKDLAKIPLDDLGVVVFDSTGISISSGALKALADHGCTLLACDDTHHPNGLFLPLVGNTLHGERIRCQADASLPLRKNLWARVVKRKILNQAALLSSPMSQGLVRLAEGVRSGDSGGCEAQAAKAYWPLVFQGLDRVPAPFKRHRDGEAPNGLLNFGYAILRALVARAVCAAGLHPGLGIHHSNRYNGFSLCDDLMEPYRPVVDHLVRDIIRSGSLTVHKETKGRLLFVVQEQVRMENQSVSVELAVEKTASSVAAAFIASVKDGVGAPEAAERILLPAMITKRPT